MAIPKSRLTLSKSTLHELLSDYYDEEIKVTSKGFKIKCPWHDDNNPSCIVFSETGNFYCFVCHGDKAKGHRGVSAYKGFTKLGMPSDSARAIFLSGDLSQVIVKKIDTSRLPSLDSFDMSYVDSSGAPTPKKRKEQVAKRETWPEGWGFRGIPHAVLTSKDFKDRFDPNLVTLHKERFPRLALAIGGAEIVKDREVPNYLRQEVYLRLSTLVKVKAINTAGLNLDPDVTDPYPATLFGLVNNKIDKECRGIFLTEGPFDAMSVLNHCQALGEKFESIGILGTPQWSNTLKQLKTFILPQIKKDIPLILAFDNDAAGFKLTKTAVNDLQSECFVQDSQVKIFSFPKKVKDVGEMTQIEFLKSLRKLNI